MKKVFHALVALGLLGLALTACAVAPESSDLCNGPVLLTATVPLPEGSDLGMETMSIRVGGEGPTIAQLDGEPRNGLYVDWYRDGEWVHSEPGSSSATYSYLAEQPGTYWTVAALYEDDELLGVEPTTESNHVVVLPCTSCERADVSVAIYGGWDGIPVNAYVGGTEQETLYTARDASGNAAVLWTFYPAAEGWDVSVAPQTPPGKDPERWRYELVRIGSRSGGAVEDPASADATIYPCSEKVFYFQLVDSGAE